MTKEMKKEVVETRRLLEEEMGNGFSLYDESGMTQRITGWYVGRIAELRSVEDKIFSEEKEDETSRV